MYLFSQVQEREHVIDYVLFDPSHGTNLGLDLREDGLAIQLGKKISSRDLMSHLNLVYAGGINPDNVGEITKTLHSYFPNRFALDIESGVRNSQNRLDMNLIRGYLSNYAKAREELHRDGR